MFIVTHYKLFLWIGTGILLVSAAIISIFGLRLSIDFTGGALTEVTYPSAVTNEELNASLASFDTLGDFSVRATMTETGDRGFIISTRDLSEVERKALHDTLIAVAPDGQIIRFTTIGPSIGEELQQKALWAITIVSMVITLYVAFAFAKVSQPVSSWVYGIITIVILLHDVLVPTAAMALLGHLSGVEVDVLFVMAILAVLGYSVNDTLVIFDRVRENLQRFRQEKKIKVVRDGVEVDGIEVVLTKPFPEIVGEALEQTLLRSINTSATTALAVGVLYFLGGPATTSFSLVLLIGIAAGTLSSLFFASSALVWAAGQSVVSIAAQAQGAEVVESATKN